MTVLFLTYQGDLAGSTLSIAYLADGLARRGHRILVGARRESLLARLLQDSPVRLVPMAFKGRFDLANMRQIRDAVRAHGVELVNAQSSRDRYTSIFARWLYRLPVALVHTRRQVSHSRGGRLQQTFYAAGTDVVVAVSEGVKRSLVAQGLSAGRVVVIPNGIPSEKCHRTVAPARLAELRRRYAIRPDDTVVGCVARRKRQEQLLRALPHLEPGVTLLFVGIDERDLAREESPPIDERHRVIFCGRVPPEEALDHYGLLTLYVLPSTIEGLSQSILEAMAFGIPVVATRAGGNEDLIRDGENGHLFEDGDVRGLAAVIRRVLERPAERAVIIENARRTATETYSLARTLDAYEDLFKRLISQQSARPAEAS